MVCSRRCVSGVSRHVAVLFLGVCTVWSQSLDHKCRVLPQGGQTSVECAQTTGDVTVQSVQKAVEFKNKTTVTIRDLAINDTDVNGIFNKFTAELIVGLEMANVTIDFNSPMVVNAFSYLDNLRTLKMDNMSIPVLSYQLLKGKARLEELGMNDDCIVVVEESAFRDLTSLQELSLRSNRLTEIPVAVGQVPKLQTLDLSGNNISTVGDHTVHRVRGNLSWLRSLYMDSLICNCDLGKGKFVEWVQTQGIEEAMCTMPANMSYQYLIDIDFKGLCDSGSTLLAVLSLVVTAAAISLLH